jgi:hypothetical protein
MCEPPQLPASCRVCSAHLAFCCFWFSCCCCCCCCRRRLAVCAGPAAHLLPSVSRPLRVFTPAVAPLIPGPHFCCPLSAGCCRGAALGRFTCASPTGPLSSSTGTMVGAQRGCTEGCTVGVHSGQVASGLLAWLTGCLDCSASWHARFSLAPAGLPAVQRQTWERSSSRCSGEPKNRAAGWQSPYAVPACPLCPRCTVKLACTHQRMNQIEHPLPPCCTAALRPCCPVAAALTCPPLTFPLAPRIPWWSSNATRWVHEWAGGTFQGRLVAGFTGGKFHMQ